MTGPQDSERVSSLRELPQAIEPARDLWPQIEARLNGIQAAAPAAPGATIPLRRSGARLRWLAAAALVALTGQRINFARPIAAEPARIPSGRGRAGACGR